MLENTDFCLQWLAIYLFRFVSICFVSFCFVSFRFVSFRFDLCRFVSICFVSFRSVSFRSVSFLFRFALYRDPFLCGKVFNLHLFCVISVFLSGNNASIKDLNGLKILKNF